MTGRQPASKAVFSKLHASRVFGSAQKISIVQFKSRQKKLTDKRENGSERERERNQSGLTLMMPARKPKRRNKNYSLIVHYYKGLKREREREKKGEERELCKKLLAWTCRTNRQTRQARRARRQILIARPVSCFVCSTYTKTTTQVSA